MPPITISIDIARPAADVFAYATDPAHFPEWQKDVVATRMVGGEPAHAGARFETSRRVGPTEQKLTQEVTETDPPHRWTARGIDGPLRPTGTLILEPAGDGSSTRVTFEIEYETHGIGRALMPIVLRQTRSGAPVSFRRLKEILERQGGGDTVE